MYTLSLVVVNYNSACSGEPSGIHYTCACLQVKMQKIRSKPKEQWKYTKKNSTAFMLKLAVVFCAVTTFGWCWTCGLEVHDIILRINDEPARQPDDLRRAVQSGNRYITILTTTPTGGQFRFCLPLPLAEPEMYCMGFLFDQEPTVGFHIVVGLIKNSPADRAGLTRGCCIRKIDGSLSLSLSFLSLFPFLPMVSRTFLLLSFSCSDPVLSLQISPPLCLP